MSTFRIQSVGFCAHYSPQGDWAFAFALSLARAQRLRLNVFHFLDDPYDPAAAAPSSSRERAALLIERERQLRLYYDDRLGDYLEAGFRLCQERSWKELHRCLARREFQVLVLGFPDSNATFGGIALQAFAESFVSPVVLVGPSSADELRLNSPAALVADQMQLAGRRYRTLDPSGAPSSSTTSCATGAAAIR
jgi:hypothetical protein